MATGDSSIVRTGQHAPHPGLRAILQKHVSSPWLQPLHRPSVLAFERLGGLLDGKPRRLVLDSGCGTGEGTRAIARREPDSLVLGVDRSMHRLRKTGHPDFPRREGNIIWVRAELETFWRLALVAGWRLRGHYILYPNPWPKKSQVRRRWHAHPVFPSLVGLGGILEMRTNWEVYAAEFAQALEVTTGAATAVSRWDEPEPLTAFERKYAASGHVLYRVSADLGSVSPGPPAPG